MQADQTARYFWNNTRRCFIIEPAREGFHEQRRRLAGGAPLRQRSGALPPI
jgi:hypothetical protein